MLVELAADEKPFREHEQVIPFGLEFQCDLAQQLVDLLVGRVAKVDIEEDTVLTWDLV